ncbi:hypothetical protein [Spirillospora sp. NPDC048824]|uniref:hypothetical protein n=1 Tax=Spirillospora sp. NPDC048824 TaxID=3364526 RepID=UPI00371C2B3F
MTVSAAGWLVTSGDSMSFEGGLVEPWAWALVAFSLAAQGVFLLTAFALYARERWSRVLGASIQVEPSVAQRSVALMAALAALAVAAVGVRWAIGDGGGFGRYEEGRVLAGRTGSASEAAAAILAALGGLSLAFPRLAQRLPIPVWLTVAATWTGSGSLFAYGLFRTVVVTAGADMSEIITPPNRSVQLAGPASGLALAACSVTLTRAARRDRRSVSHTA